MKDPRQHSLFYLVCISMAIALLFNSSAIAQFISTDLTPLDPLTFRLPATAKEVVSQRTAKAATFKLSNGEYAAVSNAQEIFTKDDKGRYVPISNACVIKGNALVFNRLPREAKVSFDLSRPSYTYSQHGYSFTVTFTAGDSSKRPAKADFEANDTVAYVLSDKAILRWKVQGGVVAKEIEILKPGPLNELSFMVEKLKNLKLRFKDGLIYLDDVNSGENKYVMKEPFLMDIKRNKLDRAVTLSQSGSEFSYQYDAKDLDFPYILDPSVGPGNPGTAVNEYYAGVETWQIPGNAIGSDNSYTTVDSTGGVRPSDFLKVTNFGFNIPAGSVINGIVVAIERKGWGVVSDQSLKLIKSGVEAGNEKSTSASWGATEGVDSFGSSSDTWNAAMTAVNINNSTSGFHIRVNVGSGVAAP